MPSRRWDPGIGVGVCLATICQDHITDSGNQDFHLVQLGRDLGINKGIYRSLRKLWIGFQWRWIQINSQIELRIYTGCFSDFDTLIISLYLMEIGLQYHRFGFFGETREEGEIKSNETEDVRLASAGFQLELAKTQAEATEGIMEATDEEKGSLEVQGMVEKQDELTDDVVKDIDMEMDAITATLLKSGMDMEAEDEFKTLSEEEAEQASGAQIVHTQAQEEEELGNGDVDITDDTGAGDLGTRQSTRKRLFKPTISTAGSNKTRMASALLSPRKRAAAKGGSRQGDSSKQLENKGPSHPKPANLKF
ncbi:hypothetical protein HID58_034212 [Brassica napus]|uniref:Uncharacterized protein n=1 Tax=Brassica napus TaxID=3708 RepID=A0ABQ8C1E6_BRANA|nr:hypothetical protein HID58_034212 [Brassica napus]